MEKSRKDYISSLWVGTPYGKWVLAAASGKMEEAEEIARSMAQAYPFTLGNADRLLCEEIAAKLKHPDEFREYLAALDAENADLVGFMISQDVLGKLY